MGETPLWVGSGAAVLNSDGTSVITHRRTFISMTKKERKSAGLISSAGGRWMSSSLLGSSNEPWKKRVSCGRRIRLCGTLVRQCLRA